MTTDARMKEIQRLQQAEKREARKKSGAAAPGRYDPASSAFKDPPAKAQKLAKVSRATLNRYGRRWFLGKKNDAGTRMWSSGHARTILLRWRDKRGRVHPGTTPRPKDGRRQSSLL